MHGAQREATPIAKGSHVYLIDGSGYIFRAFHALPPLTRTSDGIPVGAVGCEHREAEPDARPSGRFRKFAESHLDEKKARLQAPAFKP